MYKAPAPLSSLLPLLEPAGEILLLLKQNVEEREPECEVLLEHVNTDYRENERWNLNFVGGNKNEISLQYCSL
jgi:hypothetical protein